MPNPELLELSSRVRSHRRVLDARTGDVNATVARVKEVQAEIALLTQEMTNLEKVSGVLNQIGEERQLAAQQVIEELVTRGLREIFDGSLSFHILQTVKNKVANVEFVVRDTFPDGRVQETPVMEARGGGLAATIGFLLRLVVMLLRGGTKEDNIIVLDETFSHVSKEYLEPLGEFLREIVDKTGVQIVMVTHQPEFADFADRVYRFQSIDGKTQVTEGA